jgi:peptide/nickel transport system permease protein
VTAYLFRRVLQAVVVVLLVSIVVFVMTRLLPDGPARAILGPKATAAQVAQFNRANGYDNPIPVQYVSYLVRVVHGDLGYSYSLNQSVASLIGERLPKTLLLTVVSTVVAVLIALPVGLLQAVRRNRAVDHALTGLAMVLYAMPLFFLALVLIIVFALTLRWLPPEAPQGDTVAAILSQPAGLVLPVATLALVSVAAFSRYARSAALDSLAEDYIRTARAKGARTWHVLARHVTPNAVLTVVTLLGLYVPYVFSGALVVEAIFNYPGMGLLFWNAAQTRDYPTLLGVTLIIAIATVVGSLLADVLYAVLDPRVRYVTAS